MKASRLYPITVLFPLPQPSRFFLFSSSRVSYFSSQVLRPSNVSPFFTAHHHILSYFIFGLHYRVFLLLIVSSLLSSTAPYSFSHHLYLKLSSLHHFFLSSIFYSFHPPLSYLSSVSDFFSSYFISRFFFILFSHVFVLCFSFFAFFSLAFDFLSCVSNHFCSLPSSFFIQPFLIVLSGI